MSLKSLIRGRRLPSDSRSRKVVAVLGGDVDSPGCAVHVHDGPMNLAPLSGIFMQELAAERVG